MKKLLVLATGVFLSVLLIASGQAQSSADTGTGQKSQKSQKSLKAAPKKRVSKRSKAKQEVRELKKAKQRAIADSEKQN